MIEKLMIKYVDFFLEDAHFDPIAQGVLIGMASFAATLVAIISIYALLK